MKIIKNIKEIKVNFLAFHVFFFYLTAGNTYWFLRITGIFGSFRKSHWDGTLGIGENG